jgi:hypothetical protein
MKTALSFAVGPRGRTAVHLKTGILIGASAALLAAGPALAHHSFSMFDANKLVTWQGTVQEYNWANPHTHIIVNVPGTSKDPALAGTWDIEGGAIDIMRRQGWNKNSFHPGDKITLVGHPLKDGNKGGSLFYAIGKDGRKLYHDVDRTGRPSGTGDRVY